MGLILRVYRIGPWYGWRVVTTSGQQVVYSREWHTTANGAQRAGNAALLNIARAFGGVADNGGSTS